MASLTASSETLGLGKAQKASQSMGFGSRGGVMTPAAMSAASSAS